MSELFELENADDETTGEAIESAVDAIRDAKLIVFPTDTVYGIAADAFDNEAVAALLAAKGRGRDMPPPVLLPDARTVDGVATNVSEAAKALMTRFWPGALTLVVHAQPTLHWDLGDTEGTVALRVPAHEVALAVLAQTGPLAVSSANKSGQPAATSAAMAQAQLGDDVAVYLGANIADIREGSTIVDCTRTPHTVLRQGTLPFADLVSVVPDIVGVNGETAEPQAKSAEPIEATTDEEEPL